MNNMEEWMETIIDPMQRTHIDGWEMAIAVGIFILFVLFRKFAIKIMFKIFNTSSRMVRSEMSTQVQLAFEIPMRFLFVLLGLYVALEYLDIQPSDYFILEKLFRSSIIVFITCGIYNLLGTSNQWIETVGQRFNFEMDQILIPLFSKVLRFIVIALSLSIIAQEWEYDVNGFIAGLGLGGLAIAFAAKDVLANIFGGVVIITEKPFKIGDWIETPSVEGTVEEITFRSSRIRTFADSIVTIPNSTLANEAITNWSRMGKRRISFNLGVVLSTPRERLERAVTRIRAMLHKHQEIDQETLFVHFDRMESGSLEIMLYFFTKTTSWGEWLEVKEDCLMKILKILEEEEVSIAFPSSSFYFETPLNVEQIQDRSEGNGPKN